MKFKKNYEGYWFAVFKDEGEAHKWRWLFWYIFRRINVSYGQFFNAYQLTPLW